MRKNESCNIKKLDSRKGCVHEIMFCFFDPFFSPSVEEIALYCIGEDRSELLDLLHGLFCPRLFIEIGNKQPPQKGLQLYFLFIYVVVVIDNHLY